MSRTMIENIFKGVKDGYERKLEINGVGYRASLQGKNLQLALGFSHDVVYEAAAGYHDRCAEADGNRRHRHQQAAGRSGCRGDPRIPWSPSPTRARASSMPKSGSSAKKARRSKDHAKWLAGKKHLQSRANRVRRQIKAVANGRPRLSVHRSSKNIYVQVIDDVAGKTLASASTLDTDLRSSLKTGAPTRQQPLLSASSSQSAPPRPA
jgi:large subunit ribosomal protein L18